MQLSPDLLHAAHAARTGESGSAMTHAWLITGPPGSGRSTMARHFAAALLCTADVVGGSGACDDAGGSGARDDVGGSGVRDDADGSGACDGTPCGQCEGCRQALNGSHLDLTVVHPTELSISVEDMRAVIRGASRTPTVGAFRVVIIEDADRLTPAAGNSLLKTVEEPPERTVIILCAPSTDPEDMLQTLVSRCRHVYIPTPSFEEVAATVEASGVPHGQALLAAHATAGHIGRARHLAQDPTTQRRRARMLHLAELLFSGSDAYLEVTSLLSDVESDVKARIKELLDADLERTRLTLGAGGSGKGTGGVMRGTADILKKVEQKYKKQQTRELRDTIDQLLMDFIALFRDAIAQHACAPLLHTDFAGDSHDLAARLSDAQLIATIDAIGRARERITRNVTPRTALFAMIGEIRLISR